MFDKMSDWKSLVCCIKDKDSSKYTRSENLFMSGVKRIEEDFNMFRIVQSIQKM